MGLAATGLQFVQDAFFYRLPPRARRPFAYIMQSAIAAVDRHEPTRDRDQNALVFVVVAEKPASQS